LKDIAVVVVAVENVSLSEKECEYMRGVTAVRCSTDRNHYSVFDYTKLIGSASN
jgi:hypothetical protein